MAFDASKFIPDAEQAPAAFDPSKFVPDADQRGPMGEIGAGIVRGAGEALRATGATIAGGEPGPVSTALKETGKAVQGWAGEAQPETHGPVTNFLTGLVQGGIGSAPMIAADVGPRLAGAAAAPFTGGASAVASGPAAAASVATQQYRQTYDEKLEEGREKGLTGDKLEQYASDSAKAAAAIWGGVSLLPEAAIATKVGLRAAGAIAKPTAAEVATKALAGRQPGKEAAMAVVKGAPLPVAGMTGQAAAQAHIDEETGLPTVTPWEAAKGALPGALGVAGGFGIFHAYSAHTSAREALKAQDALKNPNNPFRAKVVTQVYDLMKKDDPTGAQNWLINAGEALKQKKPIGFDDSWTKAGGHPSVFPEAHEPAPEDTFENEGGGQQLPPEKIVPANAPVSEDQLGTFEGEGGGQPQAKRIGTDRMLPAPGQVAIPMREGESPEATRARFEARQAAENRELAAQRMEQSGSIGQAAAAGIRSGAVDQKAAEAAAGRDQEAAAKPKVVSEEADPNIAAFLDGVPPDSLADAQALAARRSQTQPWVVVPHPDGEGYGTVPASIIPPEKAAEHAGLQTPAENAPTLAKGMSFGTEAAADYIAGELTKKFGVEYESVEHPLARDRWTVQKKEPFTKREQAQGDEHAGQPSTTEVGTHPERGGGAGGEEGRGVGRGVEGQGLAGEGNAGVERQAGEAVQPANGEKVQSVEDHVNRLFGPLSEDIQKKSKGSNLSGEERAQVAAAIQAMAARGDITRWDGVERVHIHDDPAPMAYYPGTKSIGISRGILERHALDKENGHLELAELLDHEVWHSTDDMGGGRFASTVSKHFAIDGEGTGRTAVGGAIKELLDHYDSHGLLREMLGYPFDNFRAPAKDGGEAKHKATLSAEAFAQAGRIYNVAPEVMAIELPKTYQLFKEIHDTAKREGISVGEATQRVLSESVSAGRGEVREGRSSYNAAGDGRPSVRKSVGGESASATPEDFKQGRVGDLLKKKNWAILTAENPGNKPMSEAQNAMRNARLERDLKSGGFQYQKVIGRYGAPRDEHSFAVTGITSEQAKELGAKHNQDSVLTPKGFEHMDGSITPAIDVTEHTKAPEDYFTKMPDGTMFTVNMNWEGRGPEKIDKLNVESRPDESAIRIREGEVPKLPRNATIQDVSVALNKLAPKRSYDNPKDIISATKQLFKELKYQLSQAKSGLGWYQGDIQKAWQYAARVHPELASDPVKRQLISIVVGVHSPSVKARKNFFYGLTQYAHYKGEGNGQFSPVIDPTTGNRWSGKPAHEGALEHINAMLADHARWGGAENAERGVVNWLLTEHPRAVIQGERARYGVWDRYAVEKDLFKGRSIKFGENKDLYLGTEMFGPKVGPFIGNLNGMSTGITVDVWATRTLRRMFGTLPTERAEDKFGGDSNEVPTPQERNIISTMFRDAARDPELRKLGVVDGPDVQGVQWFFEQQLYDKMTGGTESGFFSDGARDYAEANGYDATEPGAGDPALTPAKTPRRADEAAANSELREQVFGKDDQLFAKETPSVRELTKREPAPPFYSGMDRAIAEKAPFSKSGEIGAGQLKMWLASKAKEGLVKNDEIQWTGINEWLDMIASGSNVVGVREINGKPIYNNKVTREQVQKFLNKHGVRIGEKELRRTHEGLIDERDTTEYGEWQLPGGKNYRELLLTLPERRVDTPNVFGRGDRAQARWNEAHRAADQAANFRSGHFNQPNVLAHVRFNERTDANGKKVLFIEELQSDWAQSGRKEGFDSPEKVLEKQATLRAQRDRLVEKLDDTPQGTPQHAEIVGHIRQLNNEIGMTQAYSKGVPPAPFVGKTEAWTALALKRMIRYAAENGFDRVAWTTGEQQVGRYDLSKQVKHIDYAKKSDGTYDLMIELAKPRNGQRRIMQNDLTEAKLADTVGKGAADQIVRNEGRVPGYPEGAGVLKGLDLKVGGEGMKSFYDQIVPNVANDVLKKLGGGRVDNVQIVNESPAIKRYSREAGGWTVDGDPDENVFHTKGQAEAWLEEKMRAADTFGAQHLNQQGFDITPAMKAKVLEGQPLFVKEDGARASVRELVSKVTGGKAAEMELQFTKSGDVVTEEPQMSAHDSAMWGKETPEMREAMRRAGGWVPETTLKQRWNTFTKDFAARFTQATVDRFRPLLKLDSDKPYILSRMAGAYDAGVEAIMKFGRPTLTDAGGLDLDRSKKTLPQILRPLGSMQEIQRFASWWVAQRADKLMAEGRERNLSREQIDLLKTLNKERGEDDKYTGEGGSRAMAYAQVARDLTELNDHMIDQFGVKAGTLSKETADLLRGQPYVPFHRLEENGEMSNFGGNTGAMVNQYFSKRLKGGEEVIGDPFQNLVNNWEHMIQSALKNKASNAALEAMARDGIAHKLGDLVSDKREAGWVPPEFNPKKGTFTMVDGKKQFWNIDDPMMADALAGLAPSKGFMLPKALRTFKHYLTVGTTAGPAFRLSHTLREQFGSMIFGEGTIPNAPWAQWWKGAKMSMHNHPEYGLIDSVGGTFRMGYSYGENRAAYAKRLIARGIDPKTVLDSPAAVGKAIWDWWSEVGEKSDSITRRNRFQEVYGKLTSEGMAHDEALLRAAFAARQILDYSLTGSAPWLRNLSSVVPFMNARMQGLYSIAQAAEKNPKRVAATVALVAAGTVGLSLLYANDKDMQEREDWDKDNNWAFKVGKTIYRIPKPFEIGAFATLVDRGLQTLMGGLTPTDREKFIARLFPIIGQQLNMNPLGNPMLAGPAQLWANKDWFSGNAIESEAQRNLLPQERFGPNTTGLSVAASRATAAVLPYALGQTMADKVNLSPVQLDFLINQFTGWLGFHTALLTDVMTRPALGIPARVGFPGGPSMRGAGDLPVLSRFVLDLPQNYTQAEEDFYEHAQRAAEIHQSIQTMIHVGRFKEAEELRKARGMDNNLAMMYSMARAQMGKFAQQERWTQMRQTGPSYSEDQKAADLLKINRMRATLAQQVEDMRKRQLNAP